MDSAEVVGRPALTDGQQQDQTVDGPTAERDEEMPVPDQADEWAEPTLKAYTETNRTQAFPGADFTRRETTVGTIPFLKAALHDHTRGKPSFDHIGDRQIRRLIKRMRGEDIGRLAVLKHMNNQRIDASDDPEAVQDILENGRNREVLADRMQREERIRLERQPFDRNDLRQRQDVFYRLAIHISTVPISETVREAMLPELRPDFSMPEFSMLTGHFLTLADARTGYHQYRGRGFSDVQIIPYLDHERISVFDIEKIPFVE